MGGYRWTDKEINKLKKIYYKHTNEELAEIFNRKAGAICSKANKIGLHKSKKHLSETTSKRMLGNNFRKGKPVKKETKKKISKSMKKARADIKDKIRRRKTWNNLSQQEKDNITVQSVKAMQEFWDNLTYEERLEVNKRGRKKANKYWRERYKSMSEKERKEMIEQKGIRKGWQKWWNNLTEEEQEDHYMRMIKAVPKQERTSIELKMKNVLDKLNIKYEEQKRVGKYQLDFYIPKYNLDLECDGVYWHSKANIVERDKIRDNFMKNKGYNVMRIDGDKIRENAEKYFKEKLAKWS